MLIKSYMERKNYFIGVKIEATEPAIVGGVINENSMSGCRREFIL